MDAYVIQEELWADGSVANVRALLRDLRPNASDFHGQPAFKGFKDALPFLTQGLHAPQQDNITENVARQLSLCCAPQRLAISWSHNGHMPHMFVTDEHSQNPNTSFVRKGCFDSILNNKQRRKLWEKKYIV